MKKITPSVIVLMLLSAGIGALAALLYRGDEAPAPAPARVESPKPEPKAAVPEVPGAVERALRRRIRQLEAELASARAPAPASTNGPAIPEIHPMKPQGEFRPPNPREWMENLKKNDPKKYEEIRKRFSAMRQRHLERTKGKLDFFASIDTSGMTKAERANHEKLQDLLAQREELPGPDELTDEQMRESMQQRRELDRAIRKANETERTTLLKQTASALGLDGDDAAALTETLQEVIRSTESDHHGGPPGPPPGAQR